MMTIQTLVLFLVALTHVDGSLRLRRTRVATEFGRVVALQDEHQRRFHEQANVFMLPMSHDAILPVDCSMSMPFDDDMSMPFDDFVSISFDYSMSMPFDDDMSMPFDDDFISISFDYSMSMPFDDDMYMSYDYSMSMPCHHHTPMPLDEANPGPPLLHEPHGCHDGLPFVTIPIDFEVDIPAVNDVESFSTDIISSVIENCFTMCPDSSQKLLEKERKLEESTVVGVKIINVTEINRETCDSKHSDLDCHIVNVEHQALYQIGTLANAARAEFLSELAACLSGVDGIRQRAASDTLGLGSSPTTKGDGSTEKGSRRGDGLSAGEIAMIVVFSVAAASVALVVAQQKFAENKRDDGNSVTQETTVRELPLFV